MFDHLRAAPTVDRLIVIADHGHVFASIGEQRDEFELQPVRVLKLVDHQIAEPPLPALAHFGVFREQLHREQQQIVEIHRVQRLQLGLITCEDRADQRLLIAGAGSRQPLFFAFLIRFFASVRIELLVLCRRARDDLFDQPHLIALVVDGEVSLVAERVDVLPQDPHAQRVKRRHRDLLRLRRFDHACQSFAHFIRRLVGERDREDVLRRDALRDEEGHARHDHARLPRAGARENKQRPLGRAHRALLLGIEIEKAKTGHETRTGCGAPERAQVRSGKSFRA